MLIGCSWAARRRRIETREPVRLPQPRREQEERAGGERQPRGHPHQQAGELLILERREASRMVGEIRRVPHARRDREQRAQHTAVDGGDEQIDDRRSVPRHVPDGRARCPTRRARRSRRSRGAGRRARPRARAPRRTAPGCARSTARRRRGRMPTAGARNRPPDAGNGVRWTALDDRVAKPRRHRPEDSDQRRADGDERRGDDHQELVLHHVCGQPLFAPFVERRRQRDHERQPSRRERERLERSDAAAVAGVPPQPDDAGGVDADEQDEATDKHRAPSAGSLPRGSGARTARTTRGRARP